VDKKAAAFIERLKKFIVDLGLPAKVSDWEGVVVGQDDVAEVTRMVMESMGNQPFGWRGSVTERVVSDVLKKCIL